MSWFKKFKNTEFAHFLRCFHLGLYNRFLTYFPSFTLRHFILQYLYGMKIGHQSNIHMGVRFFAPQRIRIGDYSVVHFDCILDGRCGLMIGNCVDISYQVNILTLQQDMYDPDYDTKGEPVTVGDSVVVSGRSIILPGVTIGQVAMASGAVVTKDVPPYAVVGGVPAQFIRERSHDLRYKLSYRRYFH